MNKFNNPILKIIIVMSYLIPIAIYSSELEKDGRNRYIVYSTILNSSSYGNNLFRNRQETENFTFLYGITNNYFLGINYNRGRNPESNFEGFNAINTSNQIVINDLNGSRQGEYIAIKNQYFFWNDFYLSLNFGIENNFRVVNNKYLIDNNTLVMEPITVRTTFSERIFSTLGIGYRFEFLKHLILGLEFEYGVIHSGKIRDNYTFNPQYYGGIPSDLLMQKLYFSDRGTATTGFHFLSLYFGISF